MPLERIKELELQIVALTASLARVTDSLSDANSLNKKLKRRSRREGSSFKEQLAVAQAKRA